MNLRGPAFLSLTLAIGQMVGLVRIQMLAVFLGTEVQGQAVAIGVIAGFFTSVLTMNAAWQLVQSRREDLDRFQSSLQGIAILRGAFTFILLCMAGNLALEYINQPELKPALYAIALGPLIEGFIHLDSWRRLRDGSFKSLALFQLAGPIGGILIALAALAIMRNVWVVVIVTLGTSIFRVIGSHIVAENRFRFRIFREHTRDIVRFGLPLLPAGLMYWANSQSDKFVMFLGERYESIPVFTDAEIGSYGTVAGMVLLPRGIFVTVMQSVFIPQIAQARGDAVRLRRKFTQAVAGTTGLSLLIVLGGELAGESVFVLVLGESYRLGASVAPLLLAAMGVQLLRSISYESSIAMGKTSVTFVGNTARLISIPISIVLLSKGYGVIGLAWSVYIGEIVSTLTVVAWLQATTIRHSWMILLGLVITLASTYAFQQIGGTMSELDDLARVLILMSIYTLVLGPAILYFKSHHRRQAPSGNQDFLEDDASTAKPDDLP